MNFDFTVPGNIIFGTGTTARIGDEAERLGATNAVIVTSQGMLKREGLSRIEESLKRHNLTSTIFAGIEPEPSIKDTIHCQEFTRERADLIIGLGGGSVMDVAKKTATELNLPKIMIPTTSGSGSEVTHEAVLKVEGRKRAFVDKRLTPDVAIVDPELSQTMPPRLAACSGVDALAHTIECYDSKKANLLVRSLSLEAYRIIKDNLRKAVAGDKEARINMALGAMIAGTAFGNSGTALGHALSYPLTNEGIPHGEAVAMVLPYVLEFNGFDNDVILEVKQIIKDVNLGTEFTQDINDMAKIVIEDTRHLENNPRRVNFEDIINIFRKLKNESSNTGCRQGDPALSLDKG